MSKQVWKYPLHQGAVSLSLPAEARVLAVREQRGMPCLWAEVDPTSPPKMRQFVSYGTGYELPDSPGTYIGTFFLADGALVFHVYEVAP